MFRQCLLLILQQSSHRAANQLTSQLDITAAAETQRRKTTSIKNLPSHMLLLASSWKTWMGMPSCLQDNNQQ
jgi:hypothetical protein